MKTEEKITLAIQSQLKDAEIQILDPRKDGVHLEAIVISESFEGKTLLEQQRLVMQSLRALFQEGLHALALKTYTPKTWKENHSYGNDQEN